MTHANLINKNSLRITITFYFTEIVRKPYFDEEEIAPSETDSEEDIVLLRSNRDWKTVED